MKKCKTPELAIKSGTAFIKMLLKKELMQIGFSNKESDYTEKRAEQYKYFYHSQFPYDEGTAPILFIGKIIPPAWKKFAKKEKTSKEFSAGACIFDKDTETIYMVPGMGKGSKPKVANKDVCKPLCKKYIKHAVFVADISPSATLSAPDEAAESSETDVAVDTNFDFDNFNEQEWRNQLADLQQEYTLCKKILEETVDGYYNAIQSIAKTPPNPEFLIGIKRAMLKIDSSEDGDCEILLKNYNALTELLEDCRDPNLKNTLVNDADNVKLGADIKQLNDSLNEKRLFMLNNCGPAKMLATDPTAEILDDVGANLVPSIKQLTMLMGDNYDGALDDQGHDLESLKPENIQVPNIQWPD
ncbi:MAG: hypothetical protein MK212_16060 [Saprospiraceae bacterium]|nr:hypothetical protein [Saprospiraceae bacterium]